MSRQLSRPITTGAVIAKLLFYGQRLLVYPRGFFDTQYDFVELTRIQNAEIPTPDGVFLSGSFMQHFRSKMTVIMFHGNAEITPNSRIHDHFLNTLQVNVLAFSYRGYGHSTGVPSEKGLKRDAQAALDYVLGLDLKLPIVLFGQSLGGAVAIHLAACNPDKIHALIINNTFLSIPKIVRTWPYIGYFSFLCSQRWNSASKICKIPSTTPVLMLSGQMDVVVPPKHMEELWHIRSKTIAGSATKDNFVLFPFGNHNGNEQYATFFEAITQFLAPMLEINNITGSGNTASDASSMRPHTVDSS